jgi:SAM-dependent methyltransferase
LANHDLREYYDQRAREYEQIYERDDPVRQSELATIRADLCAMLAGRRVLELACGTGYWTQPCADVAQHVLAIDVAPDVLAVAREKALPADKVEFRIGDAYALDTQAGAFDAGLAMFWLSHVPQSRMDEFLTRFHTRIGNGATVFMADNVYVSGLGGELITRPDDEDTYRRRQLCDGRECEILKNYYDRQELRSLLQGRATELEVRFGTCYWWLSYRVDDAA